MKINNEEWNNCVCPVCGKAFHLKPFAVKRFKKHYCSKKCHYIAKKEYMAGEKNHQYGLKGQKNASWQSDTRLSSYGYIMVRQPTHPFCDKEGFMLQHRLIAEQYLLTPENSVEVNGKLYLNPEYQVHHKNFDRMDNDPSNLMILTHQEHKLIHNRLNPNERDELGRFVKKEPEIIKVKRVTETAILPERLSIGAAGYDLYTDNAEPVVIKPHETVMIQSNIAFEIPKNYFGAVYARSSLSAKKGLRPATCVSVIDSDYRGSVGLPIHNDSDHERIVEPHERVAQIVFQKALIVDLELVDELEETERSDGGFGSTGRF
ncbi:MAG: dUTP diphosphatase [Ruminococcus sp.]|nr:dUTP diphosphatase [Ruminococcus sp.]